MLETFDDETENANSSCMMTRLRKEEVQGLYKGIMGIVMNTSVDGTRLKRTKINSPSAPYERKVYENVAFRLALIKIAGQNHGFLK